MSYRLRIRLAAKADVTEAAQWCNERWLRLGEKFLREVDQAIVRIVENPLAFPVILRRHEDRRVLTKRFPYRIFFSLKDVAVVVHAVYSDAAMIGTGRTGCKRWVRDSKRSRPRVRNGRVADRSLF
jgi:plasmid stabilization system protein ParE